MKKILLLLAVFFSTKAISCSFSLPKSLSIFTSLNKENYFSFDPDRSLHKVPNLRGFDCKPLVRNNKFLMIGVGPEVIEYDDQVLSYSFSDEFYPSKCTIKDSPIKLMSFEKKVSLFREKKNYIKSCFELYVEDEGRLPLKIPKENPGCNVKRISSHKAVFSGGFCFFKPTLTSSYLIRPQIKKECRTRQGLKKLGINSVDIKGIINFYSAGDSSGQSGDLAALKNSSLPMRLIVNSDEKAIASSDSYGEINPQFPSNFVIPKTHLGKIEIQDIGGQRVKLSTPLLVDNRCSKKCHGGICYSPCKYAQPTVFEAELLEIHPRNSRRKEEYLTSWYDGGVAQADYQGFIRGFGVDIPKEYIQEGKSYKVILHFRDPKFDFDKFTRKIKSKFTKIQQNLPEIGHSNIPDVPELDELLNMATLPSVREILGLNFSNGVGSLKKEVDLLKTYLNYRLWPPYYEQTCSRDLKTCRPINSEVMKIALTFKLGKLVDGKYQIKNINVVRKSPFAPKYQSKKLPYLSCGYDL